MSGDPVRRLLVNMSEREPEYQGLRFAAVSMIIRDAGDPSILLIKRAEADGDPWSGQIAFPGGKRQSGDATVRDTAIRETLEEVGIDLSENAEFKGYGPMTRTHTGTMDVVPSLFMLRKEVPVVPNPEVASYRWVPLRSLLAPEARSRYRLQRGRTFVELPSLTVGDYVIWGLTHRILGSTLGTQV